LYAIRGVGCLGLETYYPSTCPSSVGLVSDKVLKVSVSSPSQICASRVSSRSRLKRFRAHPRMLSRRIVVRLCHWRATKGNGLAKNRRISKSYFGLGHVPKSGLPAITGTFINWCPHCVFLDRRYHKVNFQPTVNGSKPLELVPGHHHVIQPSISQSTISLQV